MTKNAVVEKYFRENYDRLVKLARKRVGNYSLPNAEDAVQEAFSRACLYFRSYDKEKNFDDWFKGILSNCINKIKKDERDKGVVVSNDIEELPTVETRQVIFTKEVESVLNSVSQRDQEILNMYFFYGYKSIEISNLKGVSHDVIRDVIRRFRIKIKP